MAFLVLVRPDLDLVYTEYSDFMDTAQLVGALAATKDDPQYRPGMVELTNISGVTGTDLDFHKLLSHRARMSKHYGGQGRDTDHYVIAAKDLPFGMARIYQSLADGSVPHMKLQLFTSEWDALQAMGRRETSVKELLGTP